MIVCSCFAVTADELEQLVEDGADTVAAVRAACGAGSDCGACHEQVNEIIAVSRLLGGRTCPALRLASSEHASEGAY
jgi:bacterioferritin-associated ferredoxin